LVLLSKNRRDCAHDERQIQYVAKLLQVRKGDPVELERLFPGMQAGERWKWIAELNRVRALTAPFDLASVKGLHLPRYETVQTYARFDAADESALVHFLGQSNAGVLLDILNNAEPPKDTDTASVLAAPHRAERTSLTHERSNPSEAVASSEQDPNGTHDSNVRSAAPRVIRSTVLRRATEGIAGVIGNVCGVFLRAVFGARCPPRIVVTPSRQSRWAYLLEPLSRRDPRDRVDT